MSLVSQFLLVLFYKWGAYWVWFYFGFVCLALFVNPHKSNMKRSCSSGSWHGQYWHFGRLLWFCEMALYVAQQ